MENPILSQTKGVPTKNKRQMTLARVAWFPYSHSFSGDKVNGCFSKIPANTLFLYSAIILPKILLSLWSDMAKNYFKSYIWLLETLQSRGPLTLAQIRQLWRRSSLNELGSDLPARTFSNHIESISDIFGIEIVCDRRDNTYSIVNEDDMDGTGIRSWMPSAWIHSWTRVPVWRTESSLRTYPPATSS